MDLYDTKFLTDPDDMDTAATKSIVYLSSQKPHTVSSSFPRVSRDTPKRSRAGEAGFNPLSFICAVHSTITLRIRN